MDKESRLQLGLARLDHFISRSLSFNENDGINVAPMEDGSWYETHGRLAEPELGQEYLLHPGEYTAVIKPTDTIHHHAPDGTLLSRTKATKLPPEFVAITAPEW